jgi:uncharacterized protein
MRYNVASLLKSPVGTQMTVLVAVGHQQLGGDLVVDSIQGKVRLMRTDRRILAQGQLGVVVQAECVRCLEPVPRLPLQVDFEESFLLHPINASKRTTTYGVTDDGYLDITHPLREQIIVSIPIRPLCRPDCRGLCSQCGQNLNHGPCNCSKDDLDPRLAVLKSLLE